MNAENVITFTRPSRNLEEPRPEADIWKESYGGIHFATINGKNCEVVPCEEDAGARLFVDCKLEGYYWSPAEAMAAAVNPTRPGLLVRLRRWLLG